MRRPNHIRLRDEGLRLWGLLGGVTFYFPVHPGLRSYEVLLLNAKKLLGCSRALEPHLGCSMLLVNT